MLTKYFIYNKIIILAALLYILFACTNVTKSELSVNGNLSTKQCEHTLNGHKKVLIKKIFRNLWPFRPTKRHLNMRFFLYKRNFPKCGRELIVEDDQRLQLSGFNPHHPTRITVHGWLTQGRSAFNRAVTNAYMKLTYLQSIEGIDVSSNTSTLDFNVIVVDWGGTASNLNYFKVIKLIDNLGFLLAEFLRYLHLKTGLHMEDVYLIGHSLGCHIAGSAGQQLLPHRIHTIYALDPAGPKFRHFNDNKRLDINDAIYVESIQTSSTLGFHRSIGHATFFVNFGSYQTNCYKYGCSHSRAYHYFAESITSDLGFWGIPCYRESDGTWILLEESDEMRMGGEPSTRKNGTYYVKTNKRKPYALGRRKH